METAIKDSNLLKSKYINKDISLKDKRSIYMLYCAAQTFNKLEGINNNRDRFI